MMRWLTVLILLGLAAPAAAQTALTRAQAEAVFQEFAICHDIGGDATCDIVDVYTVHSWGDFDVIYTIPQGTHALMYLETMTWRGDQLCLSADGNGIKSIHRIDADASGWMEVRFDLLNGRLMGPEFLAQEQRQMTQLREAETCMLMVASRDAAGAIRNVSLQWDGAESSVISSHLVPRSDGGVRLTVQ